MSSGKFHHAENDPRRHGDNRRLALRRNCSASTDAGSQYLQLSPYEYPIEPGVKWPSVVATWDRLTRDNLPLTKIAELHGDPLRLVGKIGLGE